MSFDRETLHKLASLLAEHHPRPPAPISRDPFQLILWEQVAYLARDDQRLKAFQALAARVGLAPEKIAKAPLRTLQAIARIGGAIAVKERAERMKRSAVLAATLPGHRDMSMSLEEARKRLLRFPMIGGPGADRILLFSGLFNTFALDSNGLRVLLRVGIGKEGRDYAASYKNVMRELEPVLPDDRILFHERLRQHGTLICKRTAPRCGSCSLRPHCAYGCNAPHA